MDLLFAFLLTGMGHDRWQIREYSERAATWLVYLTGQPKAIQQGTHSKDLEVALRCRRVLGRYQGMYVPSFVKLYHFRDRGPCTPSWEQAAQLDAGDDACAFVRLLLVDGVPRHRVRLMVIRGTLAAVEERLYAPFPAAWFSWLYDPLELR